MSDIPLKVGGPSFEEINVTTDASKDVTKLDGNNVVKIVRNNSPLTITIVDLDNPSGAPNSQPLPRNWLVTIDS
jgi:hypothetical protein